MTAIVSGRVIWYAGALGRRMMTVSSEARCTCVWSRAGTTIELKPLLSFWYETSAASSSLVALVPSAPTSSTHRSASTTSTTAGGKRSGTRPRVEWFWMAYS